MCSIFVIVFVVDENRINSINQSINALWVKSRRSPEDKLEEANVGPTFAMR